MATLIRKSDGKVFPSVHTPDFDPQDYAEVPRDLAGKAVRWDGSMVVEDQRPAPSRPALKTRAELATEYRQLSDAQRAAITEKVVLFCLQNFNLAADVLPNQKSAAAPQE